MKKIFVAVALLVIVGVASTGHAVVVNGERQVLLASNGTITTVPAPSAIKSNGECKPTIVSSAISDEKLAQLARELRRENEKKAAILRAEMYGKGGTAKNPKGGVIGGIKEALQKIDDKVKGEEEARKLLDGRMSGLDTRLSAVEETINGDGKKVKGLKKEVREVKAVASDAQAVAYGAYNQSIAGLVLGVIGIILGILALAWLACMFFNNRRAAAAGHTP